MQTFAISIFTLSVDSKLGRLDYDSLSDQTLMELLIEGFDDKTKKEFKGKDGMYLDVCDWSGMKCDDDERVIEINMTSLHVSGLLELCYIPPKVKVLRISSWDKHTLTGSVDLARLPDGMQKLYLGQNQLTGEIDLSQLPEGVKYLSVGSNKLTGKIDLTHLPDAMGGLFLEKNQITGEIDLTHLPSEIKTLRLNNNKLTGEIDLTRLPERIEYLFLQNNELTGPLVIETLQPRIFMLDVQGNHFNSIGVVDSKTHDFIKLKGSGVTSVVDGNGKELDMKCFLG